jgi:hypothetical protein
LPDLAKAESDGQKRRGRGKVTQIHSRGEQGSGGRFVLPPTILFASLSDLPGTAEVRVGAWDGSAGRVRTGSERLQPLEVGPVLPGIPEQGSVHAVIPQKRGMGQPLRHKFRRNKPAKIPRRN